MQANEQLSASITYETEVYRVERHSLVKLKFDSLSLLFDPVVSSPSLTFFVFLFIPRPFWIMMEVELKELRVSM